MNRKIIAIVPSAGIGRRFDTSGKKPFVSLNGVPLLVHALKAFQRTASITEILPVLRPEDIDDGFKMAGDYNLTRIKRIAPGGRERQDSIYNALRLLEETEDYMNPDDLVLIHDGVRPFIPDGTMDKLIEGLEDVDGVVPGVPARDTIKEIDANNIVVSTLNREKIRAVQTPQVFNFRTIKKAYDKAYSDGIYATDDSALVERMGGSIRIIEGSPYNIKVTTPEDLEILEYLLAKRQEEL